MKKAKHESYRYLIFSCHPIVRSGVLADSRTRHKTQSVDMSHASPPPLGARPQGLAAVAIKRTAIVASSSSSSPASSPKVSGGVSSRVVTKRKQPKTGRNDKAPPHEPLGEGSFGVVLSGADVRSWTFDERRRRLTQALQDSDGLVLIRGMTDLGPQEMVELSRAVGDEVERNPGVDERFLIPGWPEVQVIGNVKSEDGELRAMFSRAPPLPTKNNVETLQYDPELRSPVWHTDQAFRSPPPFASLLYCHTAPPRGTGADTAFADMTAALAALSPEKRAQLSNLRCVCSYAHHNAKVKLRTPSYPLLTPRQREEHPPVYNPLLYVDPDTGVESLYGFSSSVCAVLPAGTQLSPEALDACELDAVEDPSVRRLMYDELLPWATRDEFVYRHEWETGDLVVWDNLRTIHTATPFDDENHPREMWRTTVASRPSIGGDDDDAVVPPPS